VGLGFYLNNRRPIDLALSLAVVVLCLYFPEKWSPFCWVVQGDISTVCLSLFGTAATLLGFVIAAATFLAAHVRADEFSILRNSTSFLQLIEIFGSAVWRLAFMMIASIIASRCQGQFLQAANIITLFSSCYAGPALIMLIWATMSILKIRPSSRR